MREKTKLVLGSAGSRVEDAITLDINTEHKPDVVHDLNITPLPFKDGQFKEIVCHHVLEHLKDLSSIMSELYRICNGAGTIYIEVPHHTSWCANTPEHKLRFNYFAFDGYVDGGITQWMRQTEKFRYLRREITFHRAFRRAFLHKLFNRFPLNYERFWTYMFPAEHLKVWLRPLKTESEK
ncbi:MAG: methyltransferase domain-containing protein [Candidatus Omnitrophica bacterium]|nr:methyltransferase domain-containing protein [Candidatus Omnitrophota bacterium]